MKPQTILFLIPVIFLLACQGNKNPCSLPGTVLRDLNRTDSLINIPEIRERDRALLKGNFKEPSLLDAENETYRFIWQGSFVGAEVYRIEKENNTYKATVRKFGYHDTVGTCSEFEIAEKTWNNIVDSLNSNNFWTFPSSDNRNVLDGSVWILEAYKPIKDKCTLKNYHRIARASPQDSIFVSMCKMFFRLKSG